MSSGNLVVANVSKMGFKTAARSNPIGAGMGARTPIMTHKEQGILSSPATSKSGILLIPKPTSDPEDPLVKCLHAISSVLPVF